MRAATKRKKQTNRLLPCLICLSMGIHFFIFLHISGFYRSKTLQYIELALSDVSKPAGRAIPRPKHRPKVPDRPHKVQRVVAKTRQVPRIKPIRVAPVSASFSNDLMEGIHVPGIETGMASGGDAYSLSDLLDTGAEYTSAKSYLEMVVLKIESKKRYPAAAKSLGKSGRVGVGFTVTGNGQVRGVRVIKPCRHEALNRAAVDAVKAAAPFPRPPHKYFKKPIPLKINLIFEIT